MGVAALAAAWLVLLAMLLMDAAGRRRLQVGRRWQGYGILLGVSAVLVSACSEAGGLPAARLRLAHDVMDAGVLSGVALLVIGLAVQFRTRLQRER